MKRKLFFLVCLILTNTLSSNLKCEKYIEFNYKGHNLKFFDSTNNNYALLSIKQEILNNEYILENLTFKPGDIMIDIGAHVGMISILYAKMYPFLKIYAFEPVPCNYEMLVKNIKKNKVTNIIAFNTAITKDGRDVIINMSDLNTGGATIQLHNIYTSGNKNYVAKSIILDEFIKNQNVTECKLLKIDCEGSEHEILLNMKNLSIVKNIIGEFHINDYLKKQGYSLERLKQYCLNHNIRMKIKDCNMFNS